MWMEARVHCAFKAGAVSDSDANNADWLQFSVMIFGNTVFFVLWYVRAQKLCESRGGRPGLPPLSLIVRKPVSVDVKQHWTWTLCAQAAVSAVFGCLRQCAVVKKTVGAAVGVWASVRAAGVKGYWVTAVRVTVRVTGGVAVKQPRTVFEWIWNFCVFDIMYWTHRNLRGLFLD